MTSVITLSTSQVKKENDESLQGGFVMDPMAIPGEGVMNNQSCGHKVFGDWGRGSQQATCTRMVLCSGEDKVWDPLAREWYKVATTP